MKKIRYLAGKLKIEVLMPEVVADELLDGKQKPRQALAQRGFCRRSGLPPEMVVKSSRSNYNLFTL